MRLVRVFTWLMVLGVCFGYLTLALAGVYLLLNNTLYNNERWDSTKTDLDYFAIGSVSFMRKNQALSRCRLDLGAWHGYQEVLFKTPVVFHEIEFEFLLRPEAYLTFIIDKNKDHFSGIRLGVNSAFPNALIAGQHDKGFRIKSPIAVAGLHPGQWNHFKMTVPENRVPSVTVNGLPVTLPDIRIPWVCTVGFRGSFASALVDNVTIRQSEDLDEIHETFLDLSESSSVFCIALILLIAANGCLLLALLAAEVERRKIPFVLLSLHIGAGLVVTALALFLNFYYLGKYPTGVEAVLTKKEQFFYLNKSNARIVEIASRYPVPAPLDTYRILFFGGSQTVGMAATHKEDAYVDVIQQRLNTAAAGEIRYECINVGLDGATSQKLTYLYEKYWANLGAKIALLSLGVNDAQSPELIREYAANLERFIAIGKQYGVRTVFVLEANSTEKYPEELETHTIMRNMAARENIPLIDAHGFLEQHQDDGFLWWDFVHPTSFGHRLIADCILDTLRPLLPLNLNRPSR